MGQSPRLNLKLRNLLLTGIVGWIVSLYSLWHRVKVRAGVGLGEAFCNLNNQVNCDSVALSPYSEIGGISVSTYGLVFFTIVILLAMRALRQKRMGGVGEITRKLILLISLAGLLTSVGLGALSLSLIGSFCLVCGIVYALCISQLVLAFQISRLVRANPPQPERVGFSTLVFFAMAIGAQFFFYPLAEFSLQQGRRAEVSEPQQILLDQMMRDLEQENSYEIPLQSSPSLGSEPAPVILVEFSDFECPHCAHNHKTIRSILPQLSSKLRVVFKNFPLDKACNSGGSHKHACLAAYAARCVYKKAGAAAFEKLREAFFDNQTSLTPEKILEVSVAAGLSSAEFQSCTKHPDIAQEIKDEVDLAKSLGVTGTPALFINGRRLKATYSQEVLQSLVEKLAERGR